MIAFKHMLLRMFSIVHNSWRTNTRNVKIRRLQYIHSRNFIHRDLKPSNLVMGVGKHANIVHIIDFSLSKEFRDPATHLHIPCTGDQGLIGTATFASIQNHLGFELGRRDDLESLTYILIYFFRGSLPWQGLEVDRVTKSKQATPLHVLCNGVPAQLRTLVEYSRSLPFDAKPNYDYLCNLFDSLLLQEGLKNDLTFNWDGSDSQTKGRTRNESVSHRCSQSKPFKGRTG
jgi:serine/threonine protein kinase